MFERIIQSEFEALLKTHYVAPNEQEIELLLQTDSQKCGRINLPLQPNAPSENNPLPQRTYSSLSSEDDPLSSDMNEYFKDNCVLHEYSLFYPKSDEVKGVIINYYGGYYGPDFQGDSKDLEPQCKKFLESNYIVIKLLTHDNWQTVPQKDQVTSIRNPEGRHLRITTLSQVLLFAKTTKNYFNSLPLIYFGSSFGAFKGGLINLLLSNKESATNKNMRFERLAPILDKCESTLFDAYVLHNGIDNDLMHFMRDFPKPISNRTLILSSYDDERIPIDETLVWLQTQFRAQINPEIITFHITPQGASWPVQTPTDKSNKNSVDGHYEPEPQQYADEYYEAIERFLNPVCPTHKSVSLFPIRYHHTHGLFYDHAYGLYYALLHAEDKKTLLQRETLSPMVHRLRQTFSLLAYKNKWKSDKQEEYQHFVLSQGATTIGKLLEKRRNMFLYWAQGINNCRAQPTFFKAPTAMEQRNDTYKHFCFTKKAQPLIQSAPKPMYLLQRISLFANHIDHLTADYFTTHQTLNNVADLVALWNLPKAPNLSIELPLASRILSRLRLEYPNPSQQVTILECIQHCKPIDTLLFELDSFLLPHDELCKLINTILAQPENEQEDFITQAALLCRIVKEDGEHYSKQITWLLSISPEKREIAVQNCLIAYNHPIRKEALDKLREDFNQLTQENFGESMLYMEQLNCSLRGY